MTRPALLIQRKRDGEELSPDELAGLVLAYARGDVPDYQMAAFCMAVYFRGLTDSETAALTDAMVKSGRTLDLQAALGRTVVDKHSTGGVGDKTTLAVAPIVAACGVPFGKMSGRGLGHTGGTLDKLEAIPGFRVELSPDELVSQVRDVGLAIASQSDDLVPADKQLYALRDVTATVEHVSLIAASIMSKKIAAGAGAILLDVKVGDGAFMKTEPDAAALARAMLELGRLQRRRVVCLLSDMEQPLGAAVGNALEVREAIAALRGEGPADFRALVLAACVHLLVLSDLGLDEGEARRRAEGAIADGSALALYERWVRAQGGDPAERALPQAPVVRDVEAERSGFVTGLGAIRIGTAALELGAGRRAKGDEIDHAVGVVCRAKRGDEVRRGEALAEIHARTRESADAAVRQVRSAYELGDSPPPAHGVVLGVLA